MEKSLEGISGLEEVAALKTLAEETPVLHKEGKDFYWTCPYCESRLEVFDKFVAVDDYIWMAKCPDCGETFEE